MRKLRYLLEYVGLRAALALIDRLSVSAACGLARRLATMWFALDRRRRATAIANVQLSGVAADTSAATRIARASFASFAELLIESLKFDQILTRPDWKDRVEMDIPDETMALLKGSGSVILISGHLGNWEVAAQMLAQFKPVTGVTKDMHNPYTNRLMKKRKAKDNFDLTPMRDANAGRFLASLKQGRILALLIDQHARRSRGTPINFFGRPVSTHTSAAMLHLITKTPIVFGYCLRTGPMQFRLKALPPIQIERSGKRKEDVQAILETLTRHLEDAIREAPEQYLWMHRRWRELRQ